VLVRACDADRCAGALSLAAFARTCRAAQGFASDAARAILQSAELCVGAFAAGAHVGNIARPGGAGWVHALYHIDLASWRSSSIVPPSLDAFRTVAQTLAIVSGAPHLLTCGPSGLATWSMNEDQRDKMCVLPCAGQIEVVAVLHLGLVAVSAAGAPGLVRILSLVEGGRTHRVVQTGCASIRALVGCGDLVVVAGEDTHVACFNAITSERLPPLLSHAPGEAVVARSGATLAVACSGRIHIFEQESPAERPQLLHVLRGDDAEASSALAVLPSGLLAAADWFGTVHVWTCRASDVEYWLGERWLPRLRIEALDEGTDTNSHGRLALSTLRDRFLMSSHEWERAIKLWNAFDGYLLARIPTPDGVLSLGCGPAMLLVVNDDGGVTVWRPAVSAHVVVETALKDGASPRGATTAGTTL
jgi:hypothetical protein